MTPGSVGSASPLDVNGASRPATWSTGSVARIVDEPGSTRRVDCRLLPPPNRLPGAACSVISLMRGGSTSVGQPTDR